MITRDDLSFFSEFYHEKKQFILVIFLWILAGRYIGFNASLVVFGSVLLFKRRGMYEEILLGFFIVLFLSDSYFAPFLFAHFAKPYYLTLLFIIFILNRNEFPIFNNFFFTFIPFFLLATYSITLSESPSLCIQKTVSYFFLFFAIPNYVVKIYTDEGPPFFRRFVLMIAIIMLIALIYYSQGWTPVGSGRFRGFFGNPNGMGLHCTTFFVFFMVIKHYFRSSFRTSEIIFVYIVIGLGVFYSGSRNTIFSIAIFLFFYRFYMISSFLGFIILFSIIISYEYISENYLDIIRGLGLGQFLRENTLEKGSGRFVAWDFGLEEIEKNIFFGKGLVHEEFIYYAYGNQKRLNLLGHEGAAHNSYIAMMLNTGVFGLTAYMIPFFGKFFKAAKNSRLAFPVLFTVLFSAMFESWLMGSLNPFTILLLIILTIMTSDEFNSEAKEESFSLL